MSNELMPCPFCGCGDIDVHDNGGGFRAKCEGCSCETWSDERDWLIYKWNTRTHAPTKDETGAGITDAMVTAALDVYGMSASYVAPEDSYADHRKHMAAALRAAIARPDEGE